jgi:hypothetical protein
MPRTLRFRDSSSTRSGHWLWLADGAPWGSPTTVSRVEARRCTDFTGRPVSDGPFDSVQFHPGLIMSGEAVGNPRGGVTWSMKFNDLPCITTGGTLSTTSLGAPSGWYLDVVARTNPSRPVLTPASLIQDFVDLPSMVKNIGDLLKRPKRILTAKELANQNLAVQFGWMPLVQDLKQLLNLQLLILKRVKELHGLYTGKGLRRRVSFDKDENFEVFTSRYNIWPDQWYDIAFSCKVKREVWATIRWHPVSPPSYIPSDRELNRIATKLVLGLTSEGLAKGTWDVIPWTWLLGWFTNVGSYLLANSNTVPAIHTSACLMNEVVVTTNAGVGQTQDMKSFSLEFGRPYIQTFKRRDVSGGLTPGFSIPFVGVRRLSILGSLFVQRFIR